MDLSLEGQQNNDEVASQTQRKLLNEVLPFLKITYVLKTKLQFVVKLVLIINVTLIL